MGLFSKRKNPDLGAQTPPGPSAAAPAPWHPVGAGAAPDGSHAYQQQTPSGTNTQVVSEDGTDIQHNADGSTLLVSNSAMHEEAAQAHVTSEPSPAPKQITINHDSAPAPAPLQTSSSSLASTSVAPTTSDASTSPMHEEIKPAPALVSEHGMGQNHDLSSNPTETGAMTPKADEEAVGLVAMTNPKVPSFMPPGLNDAPKTHPDPLDSSEVGPNAAAWNKPAADTLSATSTSSVPTGAPSLAETEFPSAKNGLVSNASNVAAPQAIDNVTQAQQHRFDVATAKSNDAAAFPLTTNPTNLHGSLVENGQVGFSGSDGSHSVAPKMVPIDSNAGHLAMGRDSVSDEIGPNAAAWTRPASAATPATPAIPATSTTPAVPAMPATPAQPTLAETVFPSASNGLSTATSTPVPTGPAFTTPTSSPARPDVTPQSSLTSFDPSSSTQVRAHHFDNDIGL